MNLGTALLNIIEHGFYDDAYNIKMIGWKRWTVKKMFDNDLNKIDNVVYTVIKEDKSFSCTCGNGHCGHIKAIKGIMERNKR